MATLESRQVFLHRWPYILSAVLAALMVVQSVLGLVFPGQYRDVEWIRATWFGNDWITLVVGAPLLVASLVLARRGSIRGLLLWLGMLGYGAYNYAYYMLGAALNAFFPLYIVPLVLSVVTLILALSRIDVAEIAASFRQKTPVRIVGGYLVFVAVGLTFVWMGVWAAYVIADQPTPVETEAFKLVAALDITIMVPALAFGGVLLWRRNAWGYIVAAIAGVQGSLYLLVLSTNSVVFILHGLAEAPGELPQWGTLAVTTTAATALLLANVRGRWEQRP
ncbi:MAG TPA: hypothetical protein VEY13_03735 [Rubrobacteraceae bacterium]|nr:hypothetical protein [Rubrobacteraceae bacterium]